MGIVISKDTIVDVDEEYIFYDLGMFSCTLKEVLERLKQYDGCDTYGYNVYLSGANRVRLFAYKDGKIFPYDFYHQIDNFDDLPSIIDENNVHSLSYDEQWCVDKYCQAIGMPEKADYLMKIQKGTA